MYGNTDRYRNTSAGFIAQLLDEQRQHLPAEQLLREPDQDPAEHGAPDAAEAAEYRGGEAEQHVREADREVEAAERTDDADPARPASTDEIPNDSIDNRLALTP